MGKKEESFDPDIDLEVGFVKMLFGSFRGAEREKEGRDREMAVCNETLVSSPAESGQQLNLEAIRSRIQEISERPRTCLDFSEISSSESEKLLQECLHHLTSNFQKIESDFSDISSLGLEDLDVYLEHLKRELNSAEAENALISDEIEALTGTCIKDSIQLESELEGLGTSLKFFDAQIEMGRKDYNTSRKWKGEAEDYLEVARYQT
ncbi:hypothetical protein CKAN_01514100 [Cinnamomum micranthum f. kanehirae]|uniref:Uncharacterized protein n=1 Tax=Cinnamomum micranthum f. kanehirae TaxID=337451 RepID=A0A3S4P6F0_9MAGN|nr:hypothetical protein CKAN_01514100 [Cinnamomum micranthum f. kanehirae]